jgi:hypothetical protein
VTGPSEPAVTVLRHNFARKPFVCVMNEVARDRSLSFRARGLLVEMLSRPSDWRFSAERLAESSPKEKTAAVQAALRELREAGYLTYVNERDERGRLRKIATVSDEPVDEWKGKPAGRTESRLPRLGEPRFGEVPPYRSTEERRTET